MRGRCGRAAAAVALVVLAAACSSAPQLATPPIPTFTFEFDEALGFIDARLPLDRRIYKKVRLVSVD